MYVTKLGEVFTVDITCGLLENLKKVMPSMKVKITEANGSTYKKEEMVEVKDLEDYSVQRNLVALQN